MSKFLENLKETIAHVEFSLSVRSALTSVRLVHETDKETFERVMKLARSRICGACSGYGREAVGGRFCACCGGTGEKS